MNEKYIYTPINYDYDYDHSDHTIMIINNNLYSKSVLEGMEEDDGWRSELEKFDGTIGNIVQKNHF